MQPIQNQGNNPILAPNVPPPEGLQPQQIQAIIHQAWQNVHLAPQVLPPILQQPMLQNADIQAALQNLVQPDLQNVFPHPDVAAEQPLNPGQVDTDVEEEEED